MVNDDLKKRIEEEMTVSYANTLEKNFDIAKEFIRITNSGTVDILNKQGLTGQDKILLYLIGKRYAKEVGKTGSEFVVNKELENELGIKRGSLLPWLKTLRDNNFLEGGNGKQAIKTSIIESVLNRIKKESGNKNG